MGLQKYDPSTAALLQLHWIPVMTMKMTMTMNSFPKHLIPSKYLFKHGVTVLNSYLNVGYKIVISIHRRRNSSNMGGGAILATKITWLYFSQGRTQRGFWGQIPRPTRPHPLPPIQSDTYRICLIYKFILAVVFCTL